MENLEQSGRDFRYLFRAMATPCEVRIETANPAMAETVSSVVQTEALRIEQKFSRYRSDNIIAQINQGESLDVPVDEETGLLLDFADEVFNLSDGLFDITSGVLRRIWRFDGTAAFPSQDEVNALMPLVGWNKVFWDGSMIRLQSGMEIDLGGLAKEYAVDRALGLAMQLCDAPLLVNFGGDLAVSGPRCDGTAWHIAIESVERMEAAALLALKEGAIATSGDAKRHIEKDGIRYGHIVDPRTGWPVRNPLRSVSVAAATCIEAGMTATLAILKGPEGAAFLSKEGVKAWVIA